MRKISGVVTKSYAFVGLHGVSLQYLSLMLGTDTIDTDIELKWSFIAHNDRG